MIVTFNLKYCDQKDGKHKKLLNLTYPRPTYFMSRVPKHYTTCSNNTHRFHRSFYQCTLFDQWSLTLMLRFSPWTGFGLIGPSWEKHVLSKGEGTLYLNWNWEEKKSEIEDFQYLEHVTSSIILNKLQLTQK